MSHLFHNLRGTEALRLLVNSVYGLLALLVTRFANQIFFILLTWTIGVVEAGTFALGLMTYAVLFTQLSILGLDFLLTREVAANRSAAGPLFGSFLALRLLTSSLCYSVVLVWVIVVRPYDAHTDLVIMVCAATIITESIGRLCQAYFAAFERISYIATINTVLGALKLLIGALILWQGGDALTAAYVVLVASLLGMIISLVLAFKRFPMPQWSGLFGSWRAYGSLIAPFALSSVLSTVELQADTMLVSQLAPGDPRLAVATYTAAAAVFLGLTLMAQGYRTAVLPMMARLYQHQPAHVAALYQKSIIYCVALTLPAAALIASHADNIARLIYSERLSSAGPVLAVIIWSLIGFSATIPAACLLITLQRQVVMMRVQLVAMVVNLAINVWLIPSVGPLGAAWARLASTTVMVVLVVAYLHWLAYPLPLLRDGARLLGGLAVLLLVDRALEWTALHWMVGACLAGLAYLITIAALGIIRAEDRALLVGTTRYTLPAVQSISD